MQEQNLTALLSDALKNPTKDAQKVKSQMTDLAVKNKIDLEKKESRNHLRTPTAEELTEMRQWAIDYKKFHKPASKREVRRATQQHFNIKIFR